MSARDPRTIANLREIGVKREIVQVLDPALSLEPAEPIEADALLARVRGRRRARGAPGRSSASTSAGSATRPSTTIARSQRRPVSPATCTSAAATSSSCRSASTPTSTSKTTSTSDAACATSSGAPAWFALLERYPHPATYMALLGACDALVLSRLHAVILGTMMGVPIAIVTYDDKVSEFVKLAGQEARMIELADFTLEALTPALDDVLGATER